MVAVLILCILTFGMNDVWSFHRTGASENLTDVDGRQLTEAAKLLSNFPAHERKDNIITELHNEPENSLSSITKLLLENPGVIPGGAIDLETNNVKSMIQPHIHSHAENRSENHRAYVINSPAQITVSSIKTGLESNAIDNTLDFNNYNNVVNKQTNDLHTLKTDSVSNKIEDNSFHLESNQQRQMVRNREIHEHFTPHEHNTPHEHYYPLTAKNQNSNLIRDVIINRPQQPYMQTRQWTTQSSAALFVTPEAELTGEQVGMTKTPVNNNLMSTNAPFSLGNEHNTIQNRFDENIFLQNERHSTAIPLNTIKTLTQHNSVTHLPSKVNSVSKRQKINQNQQREISFQVSEKEPGHSSMITPVHTNTIERVARGTTVKPRNRKITSLHENSREKSKPSIKVKASNSKPLSELNHNRVKNESNIMEHSQKALQSKRIKTTRKQFADIVKGHNKMKNDLRKQNRLWEIKRTNNSTIHPLSTRKKGGNSKLKFPTNIEIKKRKNGKSKNEIVLVINRRTSNVPTVHQNRQFDKKTTKKVVINRRSHNNSKSNSGDSTQMRAHAASKRHNNSKILSSDSKRHNNSKIPSSDSKRHNNSKIPLSDSKRHNNSNVISSDSKRHNNSKVSSLDYKRSNNLKVSSSDSKRHNNSKISSSDSKRHNNSKVSSSDSKRHNNSKVSSSDSKRHNNSKVSSSDSKRHNNSNVSSSDYKRHNNSKVSSSDSKRPSNSKVSSLESKRHNNSKVSSLDYKRSNNSKVSSSDSKRHNNSKVSLSDSKRPSNSKVSSSDSKRHNNSKVSLSDSKRPSNSKVSSSDFKRHNHSKVRSLDYERSNNSKISSPDSKRHNNSKIPSSDSTRHNNSKVSSSDSKRPSNSKVSSSDFKSHNHSEVSSLDYERSSNSKISSSDSKRHNNSKIPSSDSKRQKHSKISSSDSKRHNHSKESSSDSTRHNNSKVDSSDSKRHNSSKVSSSDSKRHNNSKVSSSDFKRHDDSKVSSSDSKRHSNSKISSSDPKRHNSKVSSSDSKRHNSSKVSSSGHVNVTIAYKQSGDKPISTTKPPLISTTHAQKRLRAVINTEEKVGELQLVISTTQRPILNTTYAHTRKQEDMYKTRKKASQDKSNGLSTTTPTTKMPLFYTTNPQKRIQGEIDKDRISKIITREKAYGLSTTIPTIQTPLLDTKYLPKQKQEELHNHRKPQIDTGKNEMLITTVSTDWNGQIPIKTTQAYAKTGKDLYYYMLSKNTVFEGTVSPDIKQSEPDLPTVFIKDGITAKPEMSTGNTPDKDRETNDTVNSLITGIPISIGKLLHTTSHDPSQFVLNNPFPPNNELRTTEPHTPTLTLTDARVYYDKKDGHDGLPELVPAQVDPLKNENNSGNVYNGNDTDATLSIAENKTAAILDHTLDHHVTPDNHVHPGNHDHNVNEIPRDWDLVLNSNYTPPSFEKAAIDFKVAASDQNDPWDRWFGSLSQNATYPLHEQLPLENNVDMPTNTTQDQVIIKNITKSDNNVAYEQNLNATSQIIQDTKPIYPELSENFTFSPGFDSATGMPTADLNHIAEDRYTTDSNYVDIQTTTPDILSGFNHLDYHNVIDKSEVVMGNNARNVSKIKMPTSKSSQNLIARWNALVKQFRQRNLNTNSQLVNFLKKTSNDKTPMNKHKLPVKKRPKITKDLKPTVEWLGINNDKLSKNMKIVPVTSSHVISHQSHDHSSHDHSHHNLGQKGHATTDTKCNKDQSYKLALDVLQTILMNMDKIKPPPVRKAPKRRYLLIPLGPETTRDSRHGVADNYIDQKANYEQMEHDTHYQGHGSVPYRVRPRNPTVHMSMHSSF